MERRRCLAILTITTLLSLLQGCGFTTGDQFLYVQMYGVAQAADDAAGDVSPKWQEYYLSSVVLLSEDGSTATTLSEDADAKTYRIVNRPQIIFTYDMSSESGNTYSGAEVTFDAAVTGESKNADNHSFSLTNTTLTLSEVFTIEESKGVDMLIKVRWKNTVSGSTMTEPTFTLSTSSN